MNVDSCVRIMRIDYIKIEQKAVQDHKSLKQCHRSDGTVRTLVYEQESNLETWGKVDSAKK